MAPIDSSNEASTITGSSEAWANLVTNIAPLLILVGERHVKDYFKVMAGRPQRLLFAAGPIGLITAITTLIRLRGTSVMKRLIGRQFETRAEVLMDVTGLSYGEVELELRNGLQERTIGTLAQAEHISRLFVNGKCTGSFTKVYEYINSTLGANALNGEPEPRSLVGICLRVRGNVTAALEERTLSTITREGKIILPTGGSDVPTNGAEPQGELKQSQLEAMAISYTVLDGVSLSLTLNNPANLSSHWKRILQPVVVVLCLGMAGLLITVNWKYSGGASKTDTALITFGMFISAIGSWFIAETVSSCTVLRHYDLRKYGPYRIGLFSDDDQQYGRYFERKKLPLVAVTSGQQSKERKAGSKTTWFKRKKPLDLHPDSVETFPITDTVVLGLMTCGYMVLYLGLRNSEWWLSISFLAIAIIASVARAVLLPDSGATAVVQETTLRNPFRSLPVLHTHFPAFPSRQQGDDSTPIEPEPFHEFVWYGANFDAMRPKRLRSHAGPFPYDGVKFSYMDNGDPSILGAILRIVLDMRRRKLQLTTEPTMEASESDASDSSGRITGVFAHRSYTSQNYWEGPIQYDVTPTQVFLRNGIYKWPLSVRFIPPKNPQPLSSLNIPMNLWAWRLLSRESPLRCDKFILEPDNLSKDPPLTSHARLLSNANVAQMIQAKTPWNLKATGSFQAYGYITTRNEPDDAKTSELDAEATRSFLLSYLWMGARIASKNFEHWSEQALLDEIRALRALHDPINTILTDGHVKEFVGVLESVGLLKLKEETFTEIDRAKIDAKSTSGEDVNRNTSGEPSMSRETTSGEDELELNLTSEDLTFLKSLRQEREHLMSRLY